MIFFSFLQLERYFQKCKNPRTKVSGRIFGHRCIHAETSYQRAVLIRGKSEKIVAQLSESMSARCVGERTFENSLNRRTKNV